MRWLRAEGVRQTLTRFLLHLSLHRLHRTTLRLHYTEASAMDSVKLTTEGVITTSIVSALVCSVLPSSFPFSASSLIRVIQDNASSSPIQRALPHPRRVAGVCIPTSAYRLLRVRRQASCLRRWVYYTGPIYLCQPSYYLDPSISSLLPPHGRAQRSKVGTAFQTLVWHRQCGRAYRPQGPGTPSSV